MAGVVAAGHPATARAAARVLADGGNAVDACVAASFAAFAVESLLTGPAAGGFLLVRPPGGGDPVIYDGAVAAPDLRGTPPAEAVAGMVDVPISFDPGVAQHFLCGAASVAVPGLVAALFAGLAAHGTRPATELAADGVALARDGSPFERRQAWVHGILSPVLRVSPEAAAQYEPLGRPPREGEVVPMPALADTLATLADRGPALLYDGPLGAALAETVTSRGGFCGVEDLRAYRACEREPVRLALPGGRTLLTNPPPSTGGLLVAVALGVLARLDPADPFPLRLARALRVAHRLRTPGLARALAADPAPPADAWLTDDRLAELAAEASHDLTGGELVDPGGVTTARPAGLGSTTHISVLDDRGGAAALTASLGIGSGDLAGATGVFANNMLGESDLSPLGPFAVAPGHRLTSMMAPSLVLDARGEPEVVVGSAGSNRLRSALTQVIWRVVVDGEHVAAAVAAPRLHCEDDRLEVEPGLEGDALGALEAAAAPRPLVRWARRNWYFGGTNACARRPDGALEGGADPRRGGLAL